MGNENNHESMSSPEQTAMSEAHNVVDRLKHGIRHAYAALELFSPDFSDGASWVELAREMLRSTGVCMQPVSVADLEQPRPDNSHMAAMSARRMRDEILERVIDTMTHSDSAISEILFLVGDQLTAIERLRAVIAERDAEITRLRHAIRVALSDQLPPGWSNVELVLMMALDGSWTVPEDEQEAPDER